MNNNNAKNIKPIYCKTGNLKVHIIYGGLKKNKSFFIESAMEHFFEHLCNNPQEAQIFYGDTIAYVKEKLEMQKIIDRRSGNNETAQFEASRESLIEDILRMNYGEADGDEAIREDMQQSKEELLRFCQSKSGERGAKLEQNIQDNNCVANRFDADKSAEDKDAMTDDDKMQPESYEDIEPATIEEEEEEPTSVPNSIELFEEILDASLEEERKEAKKAAQKHRKMSY